MGLVLNAAKPEIISRDMTTQGCLLCTLPGAQLMDPSGARLLGSPLGDDRCITTVLDEKVEVLRRLGQHLQHLSAHNALVLLYSSFALPKLLYML